MRRRDLEHKEKRSEEGIVLLFDDNKGEGIIKLSNGSRIKVRYKDVERDSIFFLFEGDRVVVYFDEKGRVIKVDTL